MTILLIATAIVFVTLTGFYIARQPAIGSYSCRRRFRTRNRAFFKQLPRLRSLIRTTVDRDLVSSQQFDRVIHLLVRRAGDDFEEILALAANGYGMGAMASLRAMYERVVTTYFLQAHPEETDRFLDFHWIQRKKVLTAIGDSIEHGLSPEVCALIDQKYDEVKNSFRVELCKECGAKGIAFKWHKYDVVTMAKKIGVQGLRDLLVRAYYLPLEQTHATAGSLLFQFEESGDDVVLTKPPVLYADHAVAIAHLLVMFAIACLKTQLNLTELDSSLEQCAKAHGEAWRNLESAA